MNTADEPRTLPLPSRRSGNALPEGTHLAEFEIRAVVGEGGFGIVYFAWDHSLHRQVAVKEYMPWSLAARTDGIRVTPRSEKSAETFTLGLRSFINEAQLLASFDHPSLLKVYRFWEDNGTAYMVMPFYQGVTLKRALAKLEAAPEEGWLGQQLGQLLDALEVMHRESCFHRDIAPDNILLLEEGRPLLLDFGAARRVIGDATQALTAFLKPGYAPVEQYAEMPQMKQGAWTDLYALGSVVHYAIVGHTPPESVARLITDTMTPLTQAAAGRYSERFLRAIDHALAVRPHERPQSVAEMRAELGLQPPKVRMRGLGDIPTAPQALDGVPSEDDATTRPPPRATSPVRASTVVAALPQSAPASVAWVAVVRWAGVAIGVAVTLAMLVWWALPTSRLAAPPASEAAATPQPAPAAVPTPAAAKPLPASAVPPAATAVQTPATAMPAPPTAEARPVANEAPAASEPDPDPRRAVGTARRSPKAAAAPASASVPIERPGTAGANDTQAESAAPPAGTAPPAAPRTTPKMSSPDPRCAEIIARVSLGESLSASERAILQGECRK